MILGFQIISNLEFCARGARELFASQYNLRVFTLGQCRQRLQNDFGAMAVELVILMRGNQILTRFDRFHRLRKHELLGGEGKIEIDNFGGARLGCSGVVCVDSSIIIDKVNTLNPTKATKVFQLITDLPNSSPHSELVYQYRCHSSEKNEGAFTLKITLAGTNGGTVFKNSSKVI
jgi:hypothetical protein